MPKHRMAAIIAGLAVFGLLWLVIERTTFGINTRAAVDNATAAQSVGINTSRLYTLAFAIGAALAALGGIIGSQLMPMESTYALKYLVLVLAVVTVGGLGTITGSFAAALLLGIMDTAAKYLVPNIASVAFYLTMFLVLTLRPQGLSSEERADMYQFSLRTPATGALFRISVPLLPEACILALGLAGFFLFPSDLAFLTNILITSLFVLSLSLVLGQAGIPTLGHAAYFGSGACSCAFCNSCDERSAACDSSLAVWWRRLSSRP